VPQPHGGNDGPCSEPVQLREVDQPSAGDDDVLVAVHAIGDWLIVNGLPHIARPDYGLARSSNRIAGLEAAGRVEAVGRNVTRFQRGDAVFGWWAPTTSSTTPRRTSATAASTTT
jgi:NADPH:quinone reductase-like Zn-dependent oxidoreductase